MFAGVLGIDPATVAHTQYANREDQQDGAGMVTASWPATGDYFLRYLLGVALAPGARENVRQFVSRYVRGRGLLPALRLGTTPYGILPITALADFMPRGTGFDVVGSQVASLVQQARGIWEGAVRTFPVQVMPGPNTTPEQALANVLGRDASSVTVNARMDTGPWLLWNLAQWDIVSGLALLWDFWNFSETVRRGGTDCHWQKSDQRGL